MDSLPGLNLATFAFARWLPFIMLVSTRVGVAFASMPAPLGSLAPVQIRAALTFALTAIFAMVYGPMQTPIPIEPSALVTAAAGEALVGAVIGLTVRVVLAAAEVAGTVASFAMALGFAHSIDPNFGENSSPPTHLLAFLSTLMFFIFNGHHAVFSALGSSLELVPPGHVLSAAFGDDAFSMGSRMMARGLQIAAPVLGTMMIVQIGLALASRAAPKVHLMYLSFAVSIGAGVLTMFVAGPSLANAIAAEIRQLPEMLASALGGV